MWIMLFEWNNGKWENYGNWNSKNTITNFSPVTALRFLQPYRTIEYNGDLIIRASAHESAPDCSKLLYTNHRKRINFKKQVATSAQLKCIWKKWTEISHIWNNNYKGSWEVNRPTPTKRKRLILIYRQFCNQYGSLRKSPSLPFPR